VGLSGTSKQHMYHPRTHSQAIHSAGITCRDLRVSCLPSSRRRPVVAQGLDGCGLDTGETPPSACVPPSKTGKGKAPRDGGRFLGWWEGAKNMSISSRHEPAVRRTGHSGS
ncbi:hypothetical protein PCANC_28802, partial [Puccinia coronata f. sp. avenae]